MISDGLERNKEELLKNIQLKNQENYENQSVSSQEKAKINQL